MGNVRLADARGYVAWLTDTTGQSYRLPSEAEWEYAARANASTRFWWGDQPEEARANCRDCGGDWSSDDPWLGSASTGNGFGIHDTSGNVNELVEDCWFRNHDGAGDDGEPRSKPDCAAAVLKGGSWHSPADEIILTTRIRYDAAIAHPHHGFRVARSIDAR